MKFLTVPGEEETQPQRQRFLDLPTEGGTAGPTKFLTLPPDIRGPYEETIQTAPDVRGRGYIEEPKPFAPTTFEATAPAALRMGAPAAGFIGGNLLVPGLGGPIGAAVAGAAGELGAQAIEMGTRGRALREGGRTAAEGMRQQYNLLTPVVAGAVGALSPRVMPNLGETAAREALVGMGVQQATHLAETGQPASGAQTVAGGVLGGGAGLLVGRGAAQAARTAQEATEAAQATAQQQAIRQRAVEQTDALRAQRAAEEAARLQRTTTGEPLPIIGGPEPIPGGPIQALETPEPPQGLVLPGPQPKPGARIVSPAGAPFPDESGQMVRDVLTRRGLPADEIERIVRETTPATPAQPPGPAIERPGPPISGERTAGQALMAQEAQAPLQQGITQALRPGPEPTGPIILPFRKGEELAPRPATPTPPPPPPAPVASAPRAPYEMAPSPLSAAEQQAQRADLTKRAGAAYPKVVGAESPALGPAPQEPTVIPFKAEEERTLQSIMERGKLMEETGGGIIEGPMGTFTLRVPDTGEQLSLSIPKPKLTKRQTSGAEGMFQRQMNEEDREHIIRVLSLREKYPSLNAATEDVLRLSETNPGAARELFNDIELAEALPQYRQLFTDPLTQQTGGARERLLSGLAGGGVGGLAGYTQGETQEERMRNALIGAGIGAGAGIGGSVLLSQVMRRGKAPAPPPASPLEDVVESFGEVKRAADSGDFKLAHDVANQALRRIDEIAAQAGKITKENRLFRVVADTLLAPGAMKERNLETVSGAARVLQRYSDLAQKLAKIAQQNTPEGEEAKKLLGKLYGSQTMTRKVMDFWRGSLTGTVRTGVRNALDASATLGTSMVNQLIRGTMEGVTTGKPLRGVQDAYTYGRSAAERGVRGLTDFLHLTSKEPDKLQKALDFYPEAGRLAQAKPEGVEGLFGKYGEKYQNAINATNIVQENFFRRAIIEADLENRLTRKGIDPKEAFANPAMIPEEDMTAAVDAALRGTMAAPPSSKFGQYLMQGFGKFPEMHLAMPFPRYVANRLYYLMEHTPAGFLRLATTAAERSRLNKTIAEQSELLSQGGTIAEKAEFNIAKSQERLGKIDSARDITSKALTGMTMIAAGATLRAEAGGEHWWEVKVGDTRIDMRPFGTIAGFMFLGELARQYATQGKITMSAGDIGQGIASAGFRAGIGLTAADLVSGRGDQTWEGWSNVAADLASMVPSGFFNPLAQTKDLAAAVQSIGTERIPQEAIQREWRDTAMTRLTGPTLNQIPFVSRTLPPRYSPTSGAPKHIEAPLSHFFGVNVQTPNRIERELARRGIPRESIYPREELKAHTREVLRGMGGAVEAQGERLLSSARYANAPAPAKNLMLKDLLTLGRAIGTREVGKRDPEMLREIMRKRQPKDVQELRELLGR